MWQAWVNNFKKNHLSHWANWKNTKSTYSLVQDGLKTIVRKSFVSSSHSMTGYESDWLNMRKPHCIRIAQTPQVFWYRVSGSGRVGIESPHWFWDSFYESSQVNKNLL